MCEQGCSHNALTKADSWLVETDQEKKLVFPIQITSIRRRPDMVVWSADARAVIMIELTVPLEDCTLGDADERKILKNDELREQCIKAGGKAWVYAVEV